MKYTAPEMTFVVFETEEIIVASSVLEEETTSIDVIGGDED